MALVVRLWTLQMGQFYAMAGMGDKQDAMRDGYFSACLPVHSLSGKAHLGM